MTDEDLLVMLKDLSNKYKQLEKYMRESKKGEKSCARISAVI